MSGTARVENSKHLQSWLALHLVPGLGPVTCKKLVAHFGSPGAVLAAPFAELAAASRLRRESLAVLEKERENLLALADNEIEQAAARGVVIVPCDDPLYPSLLQHIHDPPPVLYVQGKPELLNCQGIGVVGSRAATHYGRNIAEQMAGNLARQGFNIISGLALGIDTTAHQGALAAGGMTVAVLGCGLDVVYPPANKRLHSRIVSEGVVVSEYPFGTQPESFRFPARNRIISGLSLGVVVVEAAKRSGSLITAKHALDQGREVFAVPGRIDSVKSAGTHTLLQQGAKLVHSVNDIVEEFPYHQGSLGNQLDTAQQDTGQESLGKLNPDEATLLSCLDVYPRSIDEIVRESGFSPRKTNELLLMLELKNLVESLPGKTYQKNSTPIK